MKTSSPQFNSNFLCLLMLMIIIIIYCQSQRELRKMGWKALFWITLKYIFVCKSDCQQNRMKNQNIITCKMGHVKEINKVKPGSFWHHASNKQMKEVNTITNFCIFWGCIGGFGCCNFIAFYHCFDQTTPCCLLLLFLHEYQQQQRFFIPQENKIKHTGFETYK